jgi:hypothetical protein
LSERSILNRGGVCQGKKRQDILGYQHKEGVKGKGNDLSTGYEWWRCRDLNPGHCGYEEEKGNSEKGELDKESKNNQEDKKA